MELNTATALKKEKTEGSSGLALACGGRYVSVGPYHAERGPEGIAPFDGFCLFYIDCGELIFETREGYVFGEKDEVVLLDCRMPHTYFAKDGVSFFWFRFSGETEIRRWQPDEDSLSGVFRFRDMSSVRGYFQAVEHLLEKSVPKQEQASRLIQMLMSGIQEQQADDLSEPIRRAKRFMENYYYEELTVDRIAWEAALSRYHFSRLFRNETGMAPYEYLVDVRMRHAKRLLTDSDYSMDEIADQCHLGSASGFIRSFRKLNDMTPLQFRKMFRS